VAKKILPKILPQLCGKTKIAKKFATPFAKKISRHTPERLKKASGLGC
jgi:hypothetical protein